MGSTTPGRCEIWSTQQSFSVGHWDQRDEQNLPRKRGWESMASRKKSICVGTKAGEHGVVQGTKPGTWKEQERAASLTYYRPQSNPICRAPSHTDSTSINPALTESPWALWTPKVSLWIHNIYFFPLTGHLIRHCHIHAKNKHGLPTVYEAPKTPLDMAMLFFCTPCSQVTQLFRLMEAPSRQGCH